MNLLQAQLWSDIENWPLSFDIAVSWLFPLLESVHVIAAAMVLGAIFMVDLRLLGLSAGVYPLSQLSRELAPWSWWAFVIAVVTGLGMFITRAANHMLNPAFQWKLGLLALAGINMACFHWIISRSRSQWDLDNTPPTAARLSGALSLLLWSAVMLAGRWIGHLS